MIIDINHKPFYRKENTRVEHKATITEVEEKEGKFGKEIILHLQDIDNKHRKLSLWETHCRDLARDYKEPDTTKWIGFPVFFKAVEIAKADGNVALGWHVRGVQE